MRDEWFIRGEIPMTKSEVRAVSVSRLELPRTTLYMILGQARDLFPWRRHLGCRRAMCMPLNRRKRAAR